MIRMRDTIDRVDIAMFSVLAALLLALAVTLTYGVVVSI